MRVKRLLRKAANGLVNLSSPVTRFLPKRVLSYLSLRKKAAAGDTYYDQKAKTYEETRLLQPWWHEESEVAEKLVTGLSKEIKTVLDVPCGTGRFFDLFQDLGLQSHGLDSSEQMVSIARAKLSSQPRGGIESISP